MPDKPDYDSPWKDILERFFIDFLSFFFPDVHAGIDWENEYTFLDKEFQQLVRDSEMGRRLADKFSQIPEKIVKALSTIYDRNVLKKLVKKAVLAQSIEQFESECQGYSN
ncbi:MAG: hypothetical protein HQK62_07705 [Desulfamplus sp.]|nr:hypothetical protein [Desulfamplus sp.]